ncbi:MAG: phosphoglucosamine mutase [Cyanobacteria bacterium REEB65]|nr:phosphoglucosamine mutase [Cyanobacteria bacterium REEB65]
MGRYFGTDGIRGIANDSLTPELAFQLGRCLGAHLGSGAMPEATMRTETPNKERPLVAIGRDTRRSGSMLESALAAGLCSIGADVWRLGVVTTPAVAWIARAAGASAGVMISASHNPAPDNGIKIFSTEGFKLPDAMEAQIEDLLDAGEDRLGRPVGDRLGRVLDRPEEIWAYVRFCESLLDERLDGMRIALDCAHGAAAAIAPRVLRDLGAELFVLGVSPDGDNINDGLGSTHLGPLIDAVRTNGAHLGLAFDGDADRCLAVDESGSVIDGDRIMWLCLHHLRQIGRLPSADIVCTVMSNLGFEEAVTREGGKVVRAKVGDRYVLEEMLRRGIRIGGEQSGHLIFLDHNTTGDGLITALRLLSAIKAAGRPLSELAQGMTVYPQMLRNVRVGTVHGWQDRPGVAAALDEAESKLVGIGRLLVRASGTEPLIRVMAEGRDPAVVEQVVEDLVHFLQRELGETLATH